MQDAIFNAQFKYSLDRLPIATNHTLLSLNASEYKFLIVKSTVQLGNRLIVQVRIE